MRTAAAAGAAANALGSRSCDEVDHRLLGKQHTCIGGAIDVHRHVDAPNAARGQVQCCSRGLCSVFPAVDPDLHGQLPRHAEEVALKGLLHQALLLLRQPGRLLLRGLP